VIDGFGVRDIENIIASLVNGDLPGFGLGYCIFRPYFLSLKLFTIYYNYIILY